MAQKLQHQLKEVGLKLENPPNSKDVLIKLLKQATSFLSELGQSPSPSMLESMQPCLNAIVKPELLKHQDRDVKLLVATCICEITRVTAPEAPYSDDVLRDIFQLIVGTFSGLLDINAPSFGRRVVILETLARYKSCVVMLDLECDDLVNEMFRTFFAVSRDDHPENVLTSMQTIMVLLLEESEDVQEDLLLILLSALGREKSDVSMAARRLAMNVIEHCAGKLEPGVKQFLVSSMSGDNSPLNGQVDYHEVIYDIYRCAPQVLSGIVPYLTGELLTDKLDTRIKAVNLLGDLFALPGCVISEAFQPVFSEFLKRLTDRTVDVRMSVIQHVKNCLLSNPDRVEAPQIISALGDRLLDYDENVRRQVVAVVCDMACHDLKVVPVETATLVADRLRDKSQLVKRYTMERLAEIYRLYCLKCSEGSINSNEFGWIPGKILRCFYDKDFRAETIEVVMCGSLFPSDFTIKDRVKHWATIFSGFDKVEVKALEKILEQKQRLQQEMQKYLSHRQIYQDGDAPEYQKKIVVCFRLMSRWFTDSAKAEENFQILDQLKDVNIWKILTSLLDPNTSFQQAWTSRDDLLRILGEKHRLYDFMTTLSMKCSYLLFNKEHVKEILLEASTQKSAGNLQLTKSCMNLLVIIARFTPLLLSGAEEELVHLLRDENEIIKEGVLHILARAGGTIREQLAVTSSSVDLMLERLCLEGNRKQAKYAVHALAAITKDDGLKSLSVLYKRLVDMLEERTHLPAILQSLGCIAQTATPVFETRESEIVEFIKEKILERSNKLEDNTRTSWDDRSELCLLKSFGIKTLVKSYLPVRDAHLRLGIENLMGILKNFISFGDISKEVESSPVDKAHLRLASAKAILRLAKFWDHKIPIDIFHLTLRTSEINYPQAKKFFLSKVHQYIKDRHLDAKYACALVFNMIGSQPPEFKEDKHNLVDIIQMCHQLKARQLNVQCDANPLTAYPEYILPYLVHALAHHSSCPNVDECTDVKAFELIYRQLHLFLCVLLHGDEDGKSEISTCKETASISVIISIFQSIKCSDDIVDVMKSKNSHAICDLGLSIIKRLAKSPDDLTELIASVPLPPALYKPHENKEENNTLAGKGYTWLGGESIVAHFESLELETSGKVHVETADGDNAVIDSDIDGNEVPIGKMIRRLKARGLKAKKSVKKKPLPAEIKNSENDIDILGMVREINLDNIESPKNLKSSNGHGYIISGKPKAGMRTNDNVPVSRKRKRRKSGDAASVAVPKRKRSSLTQDLHKSSSNALKKTSREHTDHDRISSFQFSEMDVDGNSDLEGKMSTKEDITTESDLLVSCLPTSKSLLSKREVRSTGKGLSDRAHIAGEDDVDDLKKPETQVQNSKKKTIGNSKSSMGSIRKRKRRSIAGLAKCSLKQGENESTNLIGCRIKVWWPLDKQFYEGMVQSYDQEKKKHVILYDDGDVEVLNLEKEQWELINDGRKPTQLKSSELSKKMLSEQKKNRIQGGSRLNKKSIKYSSSSVKQKRTPKRVMEHGPKVVSETFVNADLCEPESKGASDLSNPEPTTVSKIYMDSGDSEGEQVGKTEKGLADEGGSDKEDISVCEEILVNDTEKNPAFAGESGKDYKSDSLGEPVEDTEESPTDIEKSGKKVKFESEGKQGGNTGKSQTNALESDKEKKLDSEEEQMDDESERTQTEESDEEKNHEADDVENPKYLNESDKEERSGSSHSGVGEDSDDEPLGMWKRRVGKAV